MPAKIKQPRMWCSEILSLRLESKSGRARKLNANLEEIWPTGALFQTGVQVPPLARLRFACGGSEYRGKVIARTFSQGLGYFVEMQFDAGCRWSQRRYRPKHLFNPLVLLANRIFEATLRRPGSAPLKATLTPPFAVAASAEGASPGSSAAWRMA